MIFQGASDNRWFEPKWFLTVKMVGLHIMGFEQKSLGLWGFLRFAGVLGAFVAAFFFVFFNPEYSKAYYVFVSAVGLYITAFYVLSDRDEPYAMPPSLKKFPSVTVLVPSYNSASTLERCLKAALTMNYPKRFSVWVLDDGSKDSTSRVLKKFPSVLVFRAKTNIGKAKQLNRAIKKAKTDLIVCLDSDTYPNPNVLLDCVPRFFIHSKVGAVTPFITVANPKSLIQRMQEVEYFSGFGFYSKVAAQLDGLYVAPGPLTVFSRKALLKINGFDEDNLTEDMEIALRLHHHGFSLEYAPSMVPTEVPSSLTGLYKQRLRWYRGTVFNLLKYKDMFFNAKLRKFGQFFFPALAVFVSTIMLSFIVIWGLILYGLFHFLVKVYWSIVAGHVPLIRILFENFTIHSLSVFALLAIVLWYVFFSKSLDLLGLKTRRDMILPALLTIFFYPLLISFTYTISLFKELRNSKRTW